MSLTPDEIEIIALVKRISVPREVADSWAKEVPPPEPDPRPTPKPMLREPIISHIDNHHV